MNSKVKWSLEADFVQACNCDYGCPCEFSAPPTGGFCQGTGVWKIDRGSYGNTRLDGLGMAFAAHWPKAIHEGGGTVCLFVDERANQEQRDALLQIGSGAAGGIPFEIISTTFSTVLDPQFVPFHFDFNGLKSKVKVGDALSISLGPILNPVTKQPESVRVQHATGFIFQEADCASADEMNVSAGSLKFSWPKKAGFVARVKYGN